MAAVSAPQATSALTPPSSSHGGQDSWTYSVPHQVETPAQSTKTNEYGASTERLPLSSKTNGNYLANKTSRPDLAQTRADTYNSSHSSKSNQPTESGYLAPARVNALNRKDSSISTSDSAPDSLLELYGTKGGLNGMDYGEGNGTKRDIYDDDSDPERSRWIHRDKLARIESQELQAAGIILPRSRAQSKSSNGRHRSRSRDQSQSNGHGKSEQSQKRQRIGQSPTEEEEESQEAAGWDLRTPEEIQEAEEQNEYYRDVSGGIKGISRIPIAKTSPLPIPVDYLERDKPVLRKQSVGQGDEDGISYPKSRGRSQSIKPLEETLAPPTPAKRLVSENSPTKKPRKTSATPRGASASQRPKTRAGSGEKAAGQRPTTRSGDLNGNSISKKPEGDPPWLASMYKPDPRLPPDQQLLPTVAKRLQQEQWEKEGKFGNVYDTEFRPLNDNEYADRRLSAQPPTATPSPNPEEQGGAQWPLKSSKSPSPTSPISRPGTAGGQGGYSTMPKLQTQGNGKPQGIPTLPSPKIKEPKEPIRMQEPPEDAKKGGCGCCVVM